MFSAYYQNVGGLRTKTTELSMTVNANDYDCISLTETWLTQSIYSAEMFDANYVVYRSDRNYEALNCTTGSGTLIAIRSIYKSSMLLGSSDPRFDDVWVLIRNNPTTLIIGSVYFSPNSSAESYQNFLQTLERMKNKYKHAKILIMGDFNLSGVNWDNDDGYLLPSNLSTPTADILVTGMLLNELQQVNHLPNEFGRYLDLIFCSELLELSIEKA